jgi:hypothetical protein
MNVLRALLALVLLSTSAFAGQPFIIHGQNVVDPFTVKDNPPAFAPGHILGEQQPGYVVPQGKVLKIKRVTMERLWGGAVILYTGPKATASYNWSATENKFKLVGDTFIQPNTLDTFSGGGLNSQDNRTIAYTNDTGGNITSATITPDNRILSTAVWETEYWLPAGSQLNIRLVAKYNPGGGWIYGWSVIGELFDA